MKYLAIVELGDKDTAFGVSVPDVKGFFSAGDSFEDAIVQAEQGLQSHIQLLSETGEKIPMPGDFKDAILQGVEPNQVLVTINIDMEFDKKERVNISLPRYVLKCVDREVDHNPAYKDRSDFIAQTALEKIFL